MYNQLYNQLHIQLRKTPYSATEHHPFFPYPNSRNTPTTLVFLIRAINRDIPIHAEYAKIGLKALISTAFSPFYISAIKRRLMPD